VNRRKVKIIIVLLSALLITGCGNKSMEDKSTNDKNMEENSMENNVQLVSEVKVFTEVTPGGQFPRSLRVVLNDKYKKEVNASDFEMIGKATNWLDPSLHDFTASFTDASVDGDVLTLTFGDFKDKYFFVDSWEISNKSDPDLIISSNQISRVVAPVADDFQYFSTNDGEEFNYNLFTPEDTSKPQPIVVVFHGYGDTHNLLVYRTSIAWAEAEAQEKRPCYVLAPVIGDEEYFQYEEREKVFAAVHDKLQKMIDAGQVDKNRVYVMGNSFGGMSSVEYMELYPNTVAGSLALCSALNYSEAAEKNLDKIGNTPIWVAQAENDGTISSENSRLLYDSLEANGNTNSKLTIYTDEEMNKAGCSPDNNSTFSYHHVEMVVMEDEQYAEWLFSQELNH